MQDMKVEELKSVPYEQLYNLLSAWQ